MAKVSISYINRALDIVEFRLLNKPEYECKMDYGKFVELFDGSKTYYIKENKYKGVVSSFYIARNENNKTKYLHWDIFGEECRMSDGFVIDHINRDMVDNRSSNLRKVRHIKNMNNLDKSISEFPCGTKKPENFNVSFIEKEDFIRFIIIKTKSDYMLE